MRLYKDNPPAFIEKKEDDLVAHYVFEILY